MKFGRWILLALLGSVSTAGWSASLVICQMKYGVTADAKEVAARMGGTIVDSMPGGFYLMEMAASPTGPLPAEVSYIEVNRNTTLPAVRQAIVSLPATAADGWYRYQPAMQLINLPRALSRSKGRGIVIADIDSGVDYSHPALRGSLTGGYDFVSSRPYSIAAMSGSLNQSSATFLDQSGATFLDQSTATFLDNATASFLDQSSATFLDASNPAHGHGTMVAGILAGMAPESMIMPLRAFDDSGEADIFSIAKAIGYAVEHGASVINMSFGVSEDSPTLREAVEYARFKGVVMIASAGNNDTGTPQFPAAYSGVIAVAATELSDKKAAFSNFGESVTVSAPGVQIISSYWGGYYSIASGTSFAAPMVAAQSALILSMGLSPDNLITSTAKNIDRFNGKYRGQLGAGRIDLYQALAPENDYIMRPRQGPEGRQTVRSNRVGR